MIILDVEMPNRSGVDVLRVLRGRGEARPVVLLTGSLTDDRLVEAIKLGVSGIVLKDSAQSILIRCLQEVGRGGRWIDKALLDRVVETVAGDEDRRDPLSNLAPREKAIVSSVAAGKKNREIAEELRMSEGSVKVYLHRIFQKLDIKSRTELALFARSLDW
jgi:two-component system nitrate/nitrite response regulator NarP